MSNGNTESILCGKTEQWTCIRLYLGSLEESSLILLILGHARGVLQNNQTGGGEQSIILHVL